MVHHILRFIITMKHVIYGAISNAARETEGALKAPLAGSGAEPPRKSNLMHFSLKI